MNNNENKYPFSVGFQKRVLCLMLRTPRFLKDYYDVLNYTYFEGIELPIIAKMVLLFFKEYKEIPTKDSLYEYIKDYYIKFEVSDIVMQAIDDCIDEIYKLDINNLRDIQNRVIKFGQRQELKKAIYSILDLMKNDENFDEARNIVDKALRVGTATNDLGLHLNKIITKIPTLAKDSTYSESQKIPTLWPTFDKYTEGGFSKQEVWIVGAMSGVGKSTCLTQLGFAALFGRYNVLHYTIGDLTDLDVILRYMARITKCEISEIIKNTDKYNEQLERCKGFYTNLYVKHYASGAVTMSQLESHLSKLVFVEEFRPDILFFDYPDEIYHEDLYKDLGDIYSSIQRISKEYNFASILASQVKNIERKTGRVIRKEDLDHSKLKYTKCDGMFSINQTQAERIAGKTRLWVDKTRRFQSNYGINMDIDYKIYSMKEIGEIEQV